MGSFLSRHFKGDAIIWVMLVLLMIVSALEMFSASSGLAYDIKYKGHFLGPIIKHLFFLVVGLCVTYVVHLVPPKKIFIWGGMVGYALSIPLLIFVLLKGQSANGAARWIHLPLIGNFQPSELAKISVVLFLCSTMAYYHNSGDVNKGFKYYLFIIFPPAVLIMLENLSTFLLLGFVCFILLYIGGVSLKKLGNMIAVGLGICLFIVLLTFVESWIIPEKSGLKVEGVERVQGKSPISFITHRTGTWLSRINEFSGKNLTEEEKEKKKFDVTSDKKVQPGHSHIAVANGKWFGRGIGNSEERDFIPQSYADFIFAVIVEEIGVLSLFIIFIYLAVLYRSCVILNKSDSYSSSFAAVGLSCLIVVQAFMHIAVVLGIIPVTGQPLPIISRGGTSILTTCAYFGVILALSRKVTEKNDKQEKPRKESKAKEKTNAEEVVAATAQKLSVG